MPAPVPPLLSEVARSIPESAFGPWRDGELVVTMRGGVLPGRCVKCNAPAGQERLHKTFRSRRPQVFFISPIGAVAYVLSAFFTPGDVTLQIGLCPDHRSKRFGAIVNSVAAIILGLSLAVCGVVLTHEVGIDRDTATLVRMGGLFIATFGAIVCARQNSVLRPKKIDDAYASFRGAGAEFVASLPPLPQLELTDDHFDRLAAMEKEFKAEYRR